MNNQRVIFYVTVLISMVIVGGQDIYVETPRVSCTDTGMNVTLTNYTTFKTLSYKVNGRVKNVVIDMHAAKGNLVIPREKLTSIGTTFQMSISVSSKPIDDGHLEPSNNKKFTVSCNYFFAGVGVATSTTTEYETHSAIVPKFDIELSTPFVIGEDTTMTIRMPGYHYAVIRSCFIGKAGDADDNLGYKIYEHCARSSSSVFIRGETFGTEKISAILKGIGLSDTNTVRIVCNLAGCKEKTTCGAVESEYGRCA